MFLFILTQRRRQGCTSSVFELIFQLLFKRTDVVDRLQRSVEKLLTTAGDVSKQLEDSVVRCEHMGATLKERNTTIDKLTIRCQELDQESSRLNDERTQLLTELHMLQQSLGKHVIDWLPSLIEVGQNWKFDTPC